MFELINKIRQKPERVKKQIAFSVAFAFSSIIFFLWLGVVYPDFRKDRESENKIAEIEKKQNPSPGILKIFGGAFSQIKNQFEKAKDTASVFTSDPLHYQAPSSQNTD